MKNELMPHGNSLSSWNCLKSNVFMILFLSVIFTGVFSCKKTGPAEALITIVDTNGKAVDGATVILKQDTVVNSSGTVANIHQEKKTDHEGNAFFSFQWEAVLNVVVKKGNDSITDYIRLEQSKTVEEKYILK